MSDEPAHEMEVEPPQHEVAPADRRLLWTAALPALAWLSQLLVGLATVRWMCSIESRWPLVLATAMALAAAVGALLACRRALRRARRPEVGEPLAGARAAVAWSGVILAGFFGLLILATAVPGVFLEPCR